MRPISRRIRARGSVVAELLSAATQGRRPNAIAAGDLADIVPLLLRSGTAALVWHALRLPAEDAEACGPAGAQLLEIYRADAIRAAIANVEVEDLFREMSAAGLDVVLGKGWSVARAYPSPGLRPYSDFDLYFRRSDHRRVLAVLAARDARPSRRIFAVDLHPGMSYLDDRDVDAIFARTCLVPVGSAHVRVFGPEDQLRLVCLHALAEGLIRPIWLCDIVYLVAAAPAGFDWDHFSAGSPRGDWCRAAVTLAHDLLGLDISALPPCASVRSLPRWLRRSVLTTWGRGLRSRGARTPMAQVRWRPAPVLRALLERWPLPIEATVGVGAPIDAAPRLPYEIVEAARRAWTYLRRRSGEGGGRREPHIAILVVGCLLPVYHRCIQAIRSTWGARSGGRVDVYYVYGGQSTKPVSGLVPIEDLIGQPRPALRDDDVWVSGDIILCGAADLNIEQRDCVLRKRLIAFGYLARQARYDFVYTVCATSYVDVDVLGQYVDGLPPQGVYQGPVGIYEPSRIPFVSGASMLLSRDVAADLSIRAAAIVAANNGAEPDDVAIGRWVAENRCQEPVEEIYRRVIAGTRATRDQSFVVPYGQGLTNYVLSPPVDQVPKPQTYHYHFHSQRIWQMEDFHQRYFGADVHRRSGARP
ncbi:MAG: nucleotidyltransferase family protein [Vicinamibacterales bacterium]